MRTIEVRRVLRPRRCYGRSMKRLLRALFSLRRRLFGGEGAPATAPESDDPRLADPWLAAVFAKLGDRYQLGPDGESGAQLLRRTARAKFHPFPVWLRAADQQIAADYEVRAHGADPAAEARRLLDARVGGPLKALGFAPGDERTEEWGGTVLTRRYSGACADPEVAAAAVRFFCTGSELQVDTAAE